MIIRNCCQVAISCASVATRPETLASFRRRLRIDEAIYGGNWRVVLLNIESCYDHRYHGEIIEIITEAQVL